MIERPTAGAEKKRTYVIKWWHGGVTEASGTSAVDAVRTAFGTLQVKHVRRKGSIARGKTLVQITWTDDTGDQVEVRLLPKEATDDR